MSGSMARTERIGPITSGMVELYTATNRVISPSVTSSNTTSAASRFVCGRASGVFSILTDSAGRPRLSPFGSGNPVSGATVGFGVVGATRFFAEPPPPPHAAATTSSAAATRTIGREGRIGGKLLGGRGRVLDRRVGFPGRPGTEDPQHIVGDGGGDGVVG